jgi:hypothetical protein
MHDTERPQSPIVGVGVSAGESMPSRHFSRRCCTAMTATAERGHRMREGWRVLVVEDNFLVATLLAEILESVGWQGVRREYSSYCGNYTYDGERLVTRVDAASDPTRIGSDQVRGVRFTSAVWPMWFR